MTKAEKKIAADRLYGIVKEMALKVGDFVCEDKDKREVEIDVESQPFKVHMKLAVTESSGLFTIYSVLPYKVPETSASEFGPYICKLNYDNMYFGMFDYSPDSGNVVFRTAMLYEESLFSNETVLKNIQYVRETVDKYNQEIFEHAK